MFKQKDEPKTAWMHPRSRHWHLIMRGANCWSDHQMLRSKVTFRIRQKHNRQGTSKPTKPNTAKLRTIIHRESFKQEMDSALAQCGGEDKFNTRRGMGSSAAGRIQHSQDISWQARRKSSSTPTTKSFRLFLAEETKPTRESCKPGTQDLPLQHIKLPADY